MAEENVKKLMGEIQEVTAKQKAASRVDEIRVMKAMLNDPSFKVSIYDKNKGLVGTRCPREEATKFVASTTSAITGLDQAQATELANNYEFTKKDATFLIENARDFTSTYLQTGRKMPLVQSEKTEASLIVRHVEQKTKKVPANMGGGTTTVPAYDKVISKSKSPKYNK